MQPIAIVTALALLQYLWLGYLVSAARIRYDVKAPAISGHPGFERAFRIHQNTLEQLVMFLPALWLFAWYVQALVGALLGLVFIAGRFVYHAGYTKDPSARGPGAMIGGVATVVLLVGGLIGAVVSWIA